MNSWSPAPVHNALYLNLGDGKFEDVAAHSGVDRIPFYGLGVAVGDFDNVPRGLTMIGTDCWICSLP